MKKRISIQVTVLIGFLSASMVLAANPKGKPDKPIEKPQSVVIRPVGGWSNPLFEKNEVSWLKAVANPTWKGDRLGTLKFDERLDGGGSHVDHPEVWQRAASIYGQDLLVNLTKNQRDDWGRKLDSPIDLLGKSNLTDQQKSEILGKQSNEELALLLFKRILQHEAVKARFQVILTEQRIQYVIRRFLLDVGRQLKAIAKNSDKMSEDEKAKAAVEEDLSKLSNEQLFERVLTQVDLRTKADAPATARGVRVGVGYGLDWSVKVDGLDQELYAMLDADAEMIKNQKRQDEEGESKHPRNWVEWIPVRIEFKEFPGNFDDYIRSVRAQLHKKQTEMLLSTPVLKNAWLGWLKKNIQLPLRGEALGFWPRPSEVIRIYNERQRKLEVLSWSLEGSKNAEFAELIVKRLGERGEAWIQEQFAKKIGADLGSDVKPGEKAGKPAPSEKGSDPAENLNVVFKHILDELSAESSDWVKKGLLKITATTEMIEFNEFDVAQSENPILKQLLGRDDGMRLFPIAQDSREPFNSRKKIKLSFRLSVDSGTPIEKADKVSPLARAHITAGIREKAIQFEIKRSLYRLFQANPFAWTHNVCEQPEWPCLEASPQALTETLMPEALASDWEKSTGTKSTLDLVDRGDELLIQRSLEKVLGFDSRKLNAVLQLD